MKSYKLLDEELQKAKAEIERLNAKVARLTSRGIEDMKFEIKTLNARLKVLQDAFEGLGLETGDFIGHGVICTPELQAAVFGDRGS